ncbi:hypothetical protein [Defluviitalea phaphyphila]|uniref:hypothetical protein n=1 Tax=Defluviitalea phaphyphila TaxID=1473580 RepID=UPI00072FCFAA|nr:hypothetical protein [Defluviitalea phaphyphila]
MYKKLNNILNIIIGSFVGVFIGHLIYKYFDYINYPELYVMQSSHWYTTIFIYGYITAVIILICIILKYFLKKFTNK